VRRDWEKYSFGDTGKPAESGGDFTEHDAVKGRRSEEAGKAGSSGDVRRSVKRRSGKRETKQVDREERGR